MKKKEKKTHKEERKKMGKRLSHNSCLDLRELSDHMFTGI
jgi:hypothetical protein